MWSLLAGIVVVVHAAYLVYQTFGALLALRDRRWLIPHLAAVTWGVVIIAMQWRCPLTNLEKSLRARAGTPYTDSYLDHYVFGTYLPDGSQPWVYGLHLVVIVVTYVVLARHWSRARRARLADL